jgi:CubicO group peptidase (beta-lactamase class C family)
LIAATICVVLAFLFAEFRPDVASAVGAGFAAHVVCSLAFDSGLDPDAVFRDYVAFELGPGAALISVDVDPVARRVDTLAAGLARASAIHREGLGCTLVAGADESALRAWRPPERTAVGRASGSGASGPGASGSRASGEGGDAAARWPIGDGGPEALPPPELAAALARAFDEPNAAAGGPLRQTLAVVVAHRGRLVAERYAEEMGPATPLLGWSMSKSVIAALVGVAVGEGRLELARPAPVPEWQSPGDPRGAITLDQLLRMSSGLAFDETYGAVNDVSRMLFTRADTGAFAASFPLAHPPDTFWSYSSGTTNVVSRILRDSFDGDLAAMWLWARARLFDPIGLRSAIFEPDASGSFIGSSFFFASARDWARLGELHLRDGVWRGERVLPRGWVEYVTTPTPAAPQGRYGAHWWLNAGDPERPERRLWPALPRDAVAMRGHSGQYVVVVPSAELVVVRLGLSHGDAGDLHGIEPLVRDVLHALSPAVAEGR